MRRNLVTDPFTAEERHQLRLKIDRARRERVKKTRKIEDSVLRETRSRSNPLCKMTPEEVEAAHRSCQDGMTLDEVAAALWRRYGFSSEARCRQSLAQRFAALGLTRAA